MVFESGEIAAAGEAHEEGKVERIVDDGAHAGDGAPVGEAADETGGFLEIFGCLDQRGTVPGAARAIEPDQNDVFDLSAVGG
jgi:hypothetical protein